MMSFIYFPIRINGITFITYTLVYIFPFCYFLCHIGWLRSLLYRLTHTQLRYTILTLLMLFAVSLIQPILQETYDFTYITLYWRYFFLILFKSLFVLAVFENRISKTGNLLLYIRYYLYSLCLYITFTIITLLSPDIKSFFRELLYMTPKEYADTLDPVYITRFGWSGFAGFGMTIYCTIGVILTCVLLLLYNKKFKEQMKYTCILFFIFLGNMFYGRSGMFISLLCILLTIFKVYFKKGKHLIVTLLTLTLSTMCFIYIAKNFNAKINTWYRWCFSILVSFLERGELHDGSLNILLNHMYWIPNITTLIFGDARYMQNGAYYMHTDSGIMRPLLYYGLPYCLLGYFSVTNMFYSIKKYLTFKIFNSKKDANFIVFLFMISTLLFEIKGEAYYIFICTLLPILILATQKTPGGVLCQN